MTSTGNTGFGRFHDDFARFYGDFAALTTGGEVAAAWSPDGRSLAYVDGPPDERHGWLVGTATGAKSPLVATARVRAGLRELTGETPPGRGLPFAAVDFAGPGLITAEVAGHRVTIDLATDEVTGTPLADADAAARAVYDLPWPSPARTYRRAVPGLDPQEAVETPSPDGRYRISTRDGDIVRRSTYDGREERWTTGGGGDVEWRFDAADPVAALLAQGGRAGQPGGAVNWSPDGSRLAAYRVDMSGVARKPKTHYLKRDDEVVYRRRATAGGVQERSRLFLLDACGGPPVELDLGDTTGTYPVFAGWLGHGARVLVARVSRDCRRVDVLAADTATGAVREVFTETGDTFVRTHHEFYYGRDLGLWVTPDGERIVWRSERDGWRHLYLYDLDGGEPRRLTCGDWPVERVVRFAGEHVYFTARHDQDRPYDLHLCRVSRGGGAVERLTAGEGVHRTVFSPGGRSFVDTVSSPARPPVSVLRRADGTELAELSRADTARLEKAGWTPPEVFTVTAADGETELWGVMYFPAGFDAGRRYPMVEYVYGGPQCPAVDHEWAGGFYTRPARALARMGYVTVVLDARGTPGRSKAFHDVIYKDWTGARLDDHATAVRQLTDRHSFLDPARVAVMGHSWGAGTAFWLLLDRPDVYSAGVCNAPALDPYGTVLYECYLGSPQRDRRAYAAADPYPFARRLTGALLIACGTSDHQTWSDAIKLSEALIRAGKDHEFVVLPGQPHWYDAPHDSHFWRKTTAFLAARIGEPRD